MLAHNAYTFLCVVNVYNIMYNLVKLLNIVSWYTLDSTVKSTLLRDRNRCTLSTFFCLLLEF